MFLQNRIRFTPWSGFDRFHQEVDRFFRDASSTTKDTLDSPACSLWSGDEEAFVTVEVPGIDPSTLDLSVERNRLTLRGEIPAREALAGEEVRCQERSSGSFHRTFEIPFPVDSGRVEASCEQGILRILLPRAEADLPRKIPVQAAIQTNRQTETIR